MEGLFTLLSLSIVMVVASFLVGSLPLSFPLSPTQLRLISTIGMGVLVGTSLIVIIPEGVETLYSANNVGHGHKARSLVERNLDVRWQPSATLDWRRHAQDRNPFDDLPGPALPNDATPGIPVVKGDITTQSEPSKDGSQKVGQDASKTNENPKDNHHVNESTHVWIGFSLISGFVMMYLIDQLPRHASSPKPPQQPYHISLDNLGRGLHRASSPNGNGERDNFLESNQPRNQQPEGRSFATTTGLIIHAAADGIALGASSTTADSNLSFIVFLAIMIHKAPAAFGLTSVLLKQGLSKRAARGHLLLFSLAAPTGAILTWALAHSLGRGLVGTEEGTRWWTGVLLLFSGGTFLYVAMLTMQDDSSFQQHQHHDTRMNGYVDGREAPQPQKPSMVDLGAAVVGMILPLILQFGHAH